MAEAPVSSTLAVSGLSHTFSNGSRIGPVTFTVEAGSCLGLVGANGAGKTTELKMICGLASIASGTLTVGGKEPVRLGPEVSITGMIEEPAFYPFLSARENLRAFSGGYSERIGRIAAALANVELEDSRLHYSKYSQGMRQRLGIARLLVCSSPVIVLDEPTNGLDPVFLHRFREIVANLKAAGHAIVLSSHMLHEVQQICDSYVMMNGGEQILGGATADLAEGATIEDLYFSAIGLT